MIFTYTSRTNYAIEINDNFVFFLTKSSDLKKNDGYLIFFYPDLNLESPRSRQGSEI